MAGSAPPPEPPDKDFEKYCWCRLPINGVSWITITLTTGDEATMGFCSEEHLDAMAERLDEIIQENARRNRQK